MRRLILILMVLMLTMTVSLADPVAMPSLEAVQLLSGYGFL